jgi:hypothetical protein
MDRFRTKDVHHSQRPVHSVGDGIHNIGIGAIIAGIVVPLARGEINGFASVIVWLLIGLDFIGLAQVLLGRLRS